jgi:uncharacterized damage-inducible protein DinB
MPMIDAILSELERESATTRRVLERTPDDKLSWRPHAKSMSLGQLALHLASLPHRISNMALHESFEARGFAQEEATSTKQILDAHDEGAGIARQNLSGMDDAALLQPWTLTRGGNAIFTSPRVGLLRTILLNHSYHHRGQLSVYLRLLDVPVPSIYGPSADDNPFA